MKFVVLTCASASEDWSDAAFELYRQKISHFVSFEIKEIKLKKNSRDEKQQKIKADSEAILNEIKSDDFVILFDECGKNLDSLQFSKQIDKVLHSGKKRCLFVIGGAFGVNDSVKMEAQLTLSLSPMVMNHLVAQTVVMEQIYRGFAILKNLPYHNG